MSFEIQIYTSNKTRKKRVIFEKKFVNGGKQMRKCHFIHYICITMFAFHYSTRLLRSIDLQKKTFTIECTRVNL